MEKTPEQIEADIQRPKYFSPSEAVEYGIIDKVLSIYISFCHLFALKIKITVLLQVIYNDRGSEDRGVVSDLKKARLI